MLKTNVIQLMKLECPDLMHVQKQMAVCMEKWTCGVCGDTMERQVMIPHPTLKMLMHESCEPAQGYGLRAMSVEQRAVIIEEQASYFNPSQEDTQTKSEGLEVEKTIFPCPPCDLNSDKMPLGPVMSDRERKRAMKYDPEVMKRMRNCVAGICDQSQVEREASCSMCGRGLHSLCAGLAKSNLATGIFNCGDCMSGSFITASNFTPEQVEQVCVEAWEMCKGALSAFAGKTYDGGAAVIKHIKEWQTQRGILTDPRTNVFALGMFLRWTCVDRHRSVNSTVRILTSQMKAMSIPLIMNDPLIKLTLVELRKGYGDAVERDTALPIGHLIAAMGFILNRKRARDVVGRMNALREAVCMLLEYMAGFRIGEAVSGSGQGHGISANNVKIFADAVELTLEDRKTCDHPITVTVARHVPSGPILDLGALLMEYLEAWNIPFVVHHQGTKDEFTQPAYYVARVDLANYTPDTFKAAPAKGYVVDGVDTRCEFEKMLLLDLNEGVRYCAKELTKRARSRVNNSNLDARFVNVYGGARGAVQSCVDDMVRLGKWEAALMEGPLLRPTHGKYALHQPMSVGSASRLVKEALTVADVEECKAGRPACDVRPGAVPKWGTHSCRRGGAKRAMDTRGMSGVESIQIDFHFGWDEMAHARDHPMQTMYAGTADRGDRTRVTAFF